MASPPTTSRTFLDTGLPLFGAPPYKVSDLSPETVAFGRKEIELAEHQMPALMALRRRHRHRKLPPGARPTRPLHMPIHTPLPLDTPTPHRPAGQRKSTTTYHNHNTAMPAAQWVHLAFAQKGAAMHLPLFKRTRAEPRRGHARKVFRVSSCDRGRAEPMPRQPN